MIDTTTTAYVHERVEADGACCWEVVVDGQVLLFTYDRAALDHLEHLLGDRLVWVPVEVGA